MRRLILPVLLLATACSVQSQNGDLRVMPPPLLADQSWHITQQVAVQGAARACTISAGELDVTQRMQNNLLAVQVATSYNRDPGDYYKVKVAGHYYETSDTMFNPVQSQAIIDDFMTADIAYTELRKRMIQWRGSDYREFDNTLPLHNFAVQYRACAKFVHR